MNFSFSLFLPLSHYSVAAKHASRSLHPAASTQPRPLQDRARGPWMDAFHQGAAVIAIGSNLPLYQCQRHNNRIVCVLGTCACACDVRTLPRRVASLYISLLLSLFTTLAFYSASQCFPEQRITISFLSALAGLLGSKVNGMIVSMIFTMIFTMIPRYLP